MLQLGGFQLGKSTGISLLKIDYVKRSVLGRKKKRKAILLNISTSGAT